MTSAEPFAKLVHQGMILGEDGEKMSKSRGNVVNPDDIVDRVRRRRDAAVRDVHGAAEGDEDVADGAGVGSGPIPGPRAPARGDAGGVTVDEPRLLHKLEAEDADVDQVTDETEGISVERLSRR